MKLLVALALLFINGAWALHLPAKDTEANSRIFNGRNADEGQFPYVVFLKTETETCGGALIGRQWVVTAGHCVFGEKSVTVYLGMTYRDKPRLTYSINNDSVVIYPGYYQDTTKDIALINIPTTNFSNTISPVPLPPIMHPYSSYAHVNAFVSGWGEKGNKGDLAGQLQWTILPTISNEMCSLTYGDIMEHELCASTTGNTSACLGDAGSPLVPVYKYTLIGLFAQGSVTGCENGVPLIFTRITYYLDWIRNVTG